MKGVYIISVEQDDRYLFRSRKYHFTLNNLIMTVKIDVHIPKRCNL